MEISFAPASSLSLDALVDLFNAAFEGYVLPFTMTPAYLNRLLIVDNLSLPDSQIILEAGEPAGLGGLAIRGVVGRVAFFGIAAPWRRKGLGRHLCARLQEVAHSLGLERLVLEVIQANIAAHALYERAGFTTTRSLLYWQLVGHQAGRDPEVIPTAPVQILPLTADWPRVPRAWQQETASLAHWLPELEGHLLQRDGEPLAYAVSRRYGTRRGVLDLALRPNIPDSAGLYQQLLSTLAHGVEELTIHNLPGDDPLTAYLPGLGFESPFGQWEMWWEVEGNLNPP